MNFKNNILMLLGIFLMFYASGCATMSGLSRMEWEYPKTKEECNSNPNYTFLGTQEDIDIITEDAPLALPFIPLAIIDLPLSFAADIIVLPYTAYRQTQYENICNSLNEK